MTHKQIETDYMAEVERVERQYDAGGIDQGQFAALCHAAKIRKLEALHRWADRLTTADTLADVLIARGIVGRRLPPPMAGAGM